MNRSRTTVLRGRCLLGWSFVSLLLSSGCGAPEHSKAALENEKPPAVVNGEIDLRDWRPGRDGPIALNGTWSFVWLPDADSPEQAARFVEVPHQWNKSEAADFSSFGFAAYRVRLLVPDPDRRTHYALRIADLNTAYRLYLNGELIHSVGNAGRTAASTVPAFRPDVVWLRMGPPGPHSGPQVSHSRPSGPTILQLEFFIANFALAKGGLDEPIQFGTLEDLHAAQERDRTLVTFTCGALAIMGVYQMILFGLRRVDRRPFWFGLFCMALAVRSVTTGEYLLARWWPWLPFSALLTFEYITLALGTVTIGVYLVHLFPRDFHSLFRPALLGVTGAYLVCVLIGPLRWGHTLVFLFQFVSLATIAYCAAMVFVGVFRRREGAVSLLLGGSVFSVAVVTDILISRGWLASLDPGGISPYALMIFVLFQAYVLSRSAARAFSTAERLSVELEDRVRRRTKDLNQARLQAEAANRAKSEFLATMTHELRTPLTSIIGTADLLAESSLDQRQTDFVRILNRAGHNLLQQVNDILDLSRIEAERLELRPEPIDLPVLVEDLLSVLRVRADQKGLTLSGALELPQLQPGEKLIGDPVRLQQVLLNLIGNGVKFTDAGSVTLEIRGESRTDEQITVSFSVSDTGIGIASEQQQRIFESFSQADSSSVRRYEGTGLGLAISRSLVELMGGQIAVESRPGSGSRFWFRLPFLIASARAEGDVTPGALADHARTKEDLRAAIAGLRILIAEDNDDNFFLVRNYLEPCGVELLHAVNGSEAVEISAAAALDLILMDIQMPVMDGYEATRLIREREQKMDVAQIPILALTANATQKDVEKTRLGGFDGHLSKPIRKQDLITAIAVYTGRAKSDL